MPNLNYSYRLAERHLLDAILHLVKASTIGRVQRFRWIAAIALANEEPEGLPTLINEVAAEDDAAKSVFHLKQAHHVLTGAMAKSREG